MEAVQAVGLEACNKAGHRQLHKKWIGLLLLSVSATALPAITHAETRITPRVELRHSFNNTTNDDFTMITALAPGFSAHIDTRRIKAQADYEFARRFGWGEELFDKGQHRLVANGQAEVIRELVFVQAGGVVTQMFRDWRGPLSSSPDANNPNQSTVSSFYVQPSLREDFGRIAALDASYRFHYSDVNNAGRIFRAGEVAPPGTDFSLAPASDSVGHEAQVSLSNSHAASRFVWTWRNRYSRDDRSDLDEFMRTYSSILDLSYSINRKVHLLGSIGYDDMYDEQDNLLVDPLTGFPILDNRGQLQVDPNEPRRVVIDRQGVTWDVGFRLTPSRRTELTIRGGRQYGDSVMNGSASYEIREGIKLTASYNESIDTFGRLFAGQLAGQPFSFMVDQTYRLGPGVILVPTEFGLLPVPGTVTNATFRSRRGQAQLSYTTERTQAVIAGFYDRRTYLDMSGRTTDPDTPVPDASLAGRSDITWGMSASMSRELSGGRTVRANLYYSNLKYALSRERKDHVIGGSVGYVVKLTERLEAAADLYSLHRSSEGAGADQRDNTLTLTLRASF